MNFHWQRMFLQKLFVVEAGWIGGIWSSLDALQSSYTSLKLGSRFRMPVTSVLGPEKWFCQSNSYNDKKKYFNISAQWTCNCSKSLWFHELEVFIRCLLVQCLRKIRTKLFSALKCTCNGCTNVLPHFRLLLNMCWQNHLEVLFSVQWFDWHYWRWVTVSGHSHPLSAVSAKPLNGFINTVMPAHF